MRKKNHFTLSKKKIILLYLGLSYMTCHSHNRTLVKFILLCHEKNPFLSFATKFISLYLATKFISLLQHKNTFLFFLGLRRACVVGARRPPARRGPAAQPSATHSRGGLALAGLPTSRMHDISTIYATPTPVPPVKSFIIKSKHHG